MKCKNCGNKLNESERFCMQCGTKNEENMDIAAAPPVMPNMQQSIQVLPHIKRKGAKGFWTGFASAFLACLLLCSVLLATGVVSVGKKRTIEGNGYKTPEAAAQAYLDALQEADVSKMISTFAVETYVQNYDFEASIDIYNIYLYNLEAQRMPTTTDLGVELNTIQRQNEIGASVFLQYATLFMKDLDLQNITQFFIDETEKKDEFIEEMSDEKYIALLASMNVKEFYTPDDLIKMDILGENFKSDMHKENIKKQIKVNGVSEIVSLAALVTIDGEDYYICMDIAKYGDKYYMLALGGQIAIYVGVISTIGGVIKT